MRRFFEKRGADNAPADTRGPIVHTSDQTTRDWNEINATDRAEIETNKNPLLPAFATLRRGPVPVIAS
jgi:hypothetical protein